MRLILFCVLTFGIAVEVCAQGRPNILFFYTDDQAVWTMSSVNPEARTPNLDRLFAQGAAFTNSFVTTPVCSPSRVGLLASRYGTEVGITDWINPREEPEVGLDAETPAWPRALQEAGYQTCLIGKWHLGVGAQFHPRLFGYDTFIGFPNGGRPPENPTLEIDGVLQEVKGLTTNILGDHAIAQLERFDAAKPFLMSVHFRAPHAAWLPVAPEDWAPFADLDPKLPDPDFPDLDVERVKRSTREYLASVAGVDRNVGRILAKLDELGLTENTVIVFTSDHGYNIGHHGIIHKGNGGWITNATRGKSIRDPGVARPNMWDTSLRVPTAVVWPGVVAPNTTIARTVTNLDWFPTLLDIANVPIPERTVLRGRSFEPLLRGETVEWDDAFFGEYSIHHYDEADLRMWRTPEWKLTVDFKNEGRNELYDLKNDPDETANVYGEGEYEDVQSRLEERLRNHMERIGDPVVR